MADFAAAILAGRVVVGTVSAGPLRLSLQAAEDLAGKILETLRPVCEPGYCVAAGSLRRRCANVGDLEFVVIPKFSASLIAGVPGVSLLELELNALVQRGRLLRANKGETLKQFFVPALFREGHCFKVEINVSDFDRWPVELAIKTGSAEFSKKLVTWRKQGGFLPGHWRIRDGWQVWQGEERLIFESERQFIEAVCGQWVPPEKRD